MYLRCNRTAEKVNGCWEIKIRAESPCEKNERKKENKENKKKNGKTYSSSTQSVNERKRRRKEPVTVKPIHDE